MQSLWKKRLAALVIDAVFVTIIVWIIGAIIYPLIAVTNIYGILNYWFILTAIIILGYFTYLESNYGLTLGKNLLKLKVTADEGQITYKKALIRNLSKILWLPLIVDIIAVHFTDSSKLRYLDVVADTDVQSLETEDKKKINSSSEPNSVV